MSEELMPCPFCGSDDIDPRSGGSPECYNCGAKPGNSNWNDRWCECAPSPSPTLRTVLDMLNSNASRDNIRRVIEAELGGE